MRTIHSLLSAVLPGLALACSLIPGCNTLATDRPHAVAPARPETLRAEPVPVTLHEALESLGRGLSGRDFQAMQVQSEEDAVASLNRVARFIQDAWIVAEDAALAPVLASAGFESEDMADAVLRSFWRRLHDRPLDLDDQARRAREARDGALSASRAVIFPQEAAATLLRQCGRRVPEPITGTWMPDADTIERLERALPPALQRALDRRARPQSVNRRAAHYYRQYGGLIVSGRRIVYINGFSQFHLGLSGSSGFSEAGFWRNTPVVVCDGGVDFFGAEYDPDTDVVHSIEFNS